MYRLELLIALGTANPPHTTHCLLLSIRLYKNIGRLVKKIINPCCSRAGAPIPGRNSCTRSGGNRKRARRYLL